MLVVSPELEAWVGEELGTEYAAMKERREAFEERKLLKGANNLNPVLSSSRRLLRPAAAPCLAPFAGWLNGALLDPSSC